MQNGKLLLTPESWLKIRQIPKSLSIYGRLNFDALFAAHPPERGQVLVFNKQSSKPEWKKEQCRRWMKSYLQTPRMDPTHPDQRSYMFSGIPDDASSRGDVPLVFSPFVKWMKKKDPRYNQVVINWYNPEDYIPFHRDCSLQMITNHQISVLSLYAEDTHERPIWFERVGPSSIFPILLPHGSMLTLGGKMQTEFRHAIAAGKGRRISISFRQMKE